MNEESVHARTPATATWRSMHNTANGRRIERTKLADITAQLAALDTMSLPELKSKYEELYGEPTPSRYKNHLRKRLAWRIQELAEGGLSERAVRRIAELGDELPERWRMRMAKPLPPSEPPGAPQPALRGEGRILRVRHAKLLDCGRYGQADAQHLDVVRRV